MMTRPRLLGFLLVLALAVSVALLGFAARPPAEREQMAAAYALAGLPMPDLCADGPEKGSPGGHCPACHLVAAAVVPPLVLTARDAELRFLAEVVAPRESRAVRAVLDPARGLRAPPTA